MAALLSVSCAGRTSRLVLKPEELPGIPARPFIITDHKNIAAGEEMPPWIIAMLDEGIAGIEARYEFRGRYVFISRNEGNNFSAMTRWMINFSTELDFPRLAAARIEARFDAASPLPDQEFGAYYEALVCAASDYPWKDAVRVDDFWIKKSYLPVEDEEEKETWEFLILVTLEKERFATQLEEVFKNVKPNPQPAKDQINAANRVKDRFFDGF